MASDPSNKGVEIVKKLRLERDAAQRALDTEHRPERIKLIGEYLRALDFSIKTVLEVSQNE